MNKFVYLCVSLLTLHSEVCSGSLANWETMQHYYHTLVSNISSIPPAISENDLCHSYWQKTRTNIRKIVLGHDPNFLRNEITGTMVRTGMSIVQAYEICFLTECASDEVKNMIQGFQDTNFGHLPKECEVFKCSSSTLGHLFYAAQTIDLMEKTPNVIIEFGGGYGNLARIYKSFFPKNTYIIIDLPELVALQYFFIKETLPDTRVVFHTEPPKVYEEGAIHLVAVNYLKDMDLECDLFISTFAISEASSPIQAIIHNKKFFNADMVYIAGQLNGWDASMNFVHHGFILSSLRSHYQYIDCRPYHLLDMKSYTVVAKNFD